MNSKESILIFGGGFLQLSIIRNCKLKGLFSVVIDPNPEALSKIEADAFEVVAGDDFEGTVAVCKRYDIKGIITAATDKPLVMMARIAKELNFIFFNVDAAKISTDKLLMKNLFINGGIPHAPGIEILSPNDCTLSFPVIIKPRDNSGSRGVVLCNSILELEEAFNEAKKFTNKPTLLVEEFVEGKEYSIEALHYNGKSRVIQYTEKFITPFPYNVELGHTQPADLSNEIKNRIDKLICKIAIVMGFENCSSHTELKINDKGITIIETSPRLGGDMITSLLVPLSTGINMESALIDIAIGKVPHLPHPLNNSSAIRYFSLPIGKIISKGDIEMVNKLPHVVCFNFSLNEGDIVPKITNSLDRYGYVVVDDITVLPKIYSIVEHNIVIEQ